MLIPPFQALDLALGNAAKAMGLEREIGSIEKGKKADIVVIEPDSPSPVTRESLIGYYTMTFKGDQVEHVIVDGRQVIEKKKLLTADEAEVKRECLEQAKALWRRNGIKV
jgi:cytosine/adenosine deaminase-related metal-dependent hydrolase